MSMIPLINVLSSFPRHPQSIYPPISYLHSPHFSTARCTKVCPVLWTHSSRCPQFFPSNSSSVSSQSFQQRSSSFSFQFINALLSVTQFIVFPSVFSFLQFPVRRLSYPFSSLHPPSIRHFTASSSSFPFLMSQHAPSSFTAYPFQLPACSF